MVRGPMPGAMNHRCWASFLPRSPFVTLKVQTLKLRKSVTQKETFIMTIRAVQTV